MNDNILAVGMVSIQPVCAGVMPMADRMKLAMKEGQNNWVTTDEEMRFKCAVGAACVEAEKAGDTEGYEQVILELKFLQSLGSAISGVPVDICAALDGIKDDKVIGLLKLWDEAKKG